ncbi:MAG: right-handed parallel beta-helix repeat-containing protein [Planctomycetes bacterium]|nr:right-handed parallel beta-helix repeat-containing protein [Planctomycetota bacterium]
MNMKLHALQVLLALTATIRAADAQTITVDIEDASIFDVSTTATVADLPGPDGHISFGEAMVASNNTPGRQTVAFAIPTSAWTYNPQWYPGVAVIFGWVPNMSADDEVTLDGTTQTAFTGDTNPNGWEVQFLTQFFVAADNCGITGLHGLDVWVDGSYCVIENNSAVSVHLYGGFGGSSSAGNLVKGNTGLGFLHIDQSSDNVVVGNTFRQVRVYGYVAGGFPAVNNRIGGPTLAERNFIVGTGTWNSEGFPGGFALQIVDTTNLVVENNQIGTTVDGMSIGHAASIAGILIDGVNNNTTIRNNRVAGVLATVVPPHQPGYQAGTAIRIGGSGSGLQIVGNKIGLNALDQPALGSITGIETLHWWNPIGVQNVRIGGSAPGEGNEIAGHLGSGISVANTFSGVRIVGNSIHDNGGLGIDLVTSLFVHGVTPNDPLDVDTGGNGLQNFPLIQSLTSTATALRIVGTLNSSVSSSFAIEFFASPQADASGFGEGEVYLGSTNLSTNASGLANGGGSVTIYCTAKTNSLGCLPRIGSSGTLSLGDASPFVVTAQQVLNGKNGLLFYGTTGRAAVPFLGGTLCTKQPVKRTMVQNAGGSMPPVADCSGTYSFDLDAWIASGNDPALTLGDVVDAQYWSRDVASSSGVGLTDALEFFVTP